MQRIADGEIWLDASELSHSAEAKALCWQTLDVQPSMERDHELSGADSRQAALESQRAAKRETSRPVPEPAFETGPGPARKPRVMLIDGAADAECCQIGQLFKQFGVTGVFKGERFR